MPDKLPSGLIVAGIIELEATDPLAGLGLRSSRSAAISIRVLWAGSVRAG